VEDDGLFEIRTDIDWPTAPPGWVSKNSTIMTHISIDPGLSGTITVGKGRPYETINSLLRDLY